MNDDNDNGTHNAGKTSNETGQVPGQRNVRMEVEGTEKQHLQSQQMSNNRNEMIEVKCNPKTRAWQKLPVGTKLHNNPCQVVAEKLKMGNLHYDLKFMRKFHYLWHEEKDP